MLRESPRAWAVISLEAWVVALVMPAVTPPAACNQASGQTGRRPVSGRVAHQRVLQGGQRGQRLRADVAGEQGAVLRRQVAQVLAVADPAGPGQLGELLAVGGRELPGGQVRQHQRVFLAEQVLGPADPQHGERLGAHVHVGFLQYHLFQQGELSEIEDVVVGQRPVPGYDLGPDLAVQRGQPGRVAEQHGDGLFLTGGRVAGGGTGRECGTHRGRGGTASCSRRSRARPGWPRSAGTGRPGPAPRSVSRALGGVPCGQGSGVLQRVRPGQVDGIPGRQAQREDVEPDQGQHGNENEKQDLLANRPETQPHGPGLTSSTECDRSATKELRRPPRSNGA